MFFQQKTLSIRPWGRLEGCTTVEGQCTPQKNLTNSNVEKKKINIGGVGMIRPGGHKRQRGLYRPKKASVYLTHCVLTGKSPQKDRACGTSEENGQGGKAGFAPLTIWLGGLVLFFCCLWLWGFMWGFFSP